MRCNEEFLLRRENPTYRYWAPVAAARRGFKMVLFTASRGNTFVGGRCALLSALLVSTITRCATGTGELAEMAPVCRELVLLPRDQRQSSVGPASETTAASINNLPANYSGRVTMHVPEYLVEVSVRTDDGETGALTDARFGEKAMVPLNSGIRLQVSEISLNS